MRAHYGWKLLGAAVLATLGVWGTGAATARAQTYQYQMFAWNDLGMHCYDSDFSLFTLLPPFNTVHAQVVRKGSTPLLLGSSQVTAYYSGVPDPAGSLNTTSVNKSNFWKYSPKIFGVTLKPDTGILGAVMPGPRNTARAMTFDNTVKWASVTGLPITCIDNSGNFNPYPMLRFKAVPKGASAAATTLDAVVPVSYEMDCKSCHASGGIAAGTAQQQAGLTLSTNANADLQSRENILHLHDVRYGTSLWANRPVLCASCHYSTALDLSGQGPAGSQIGHENLSQAMHRRHGKTLNDQLPTTGNPPIIAGAGVQACYKCHPGNDTNCLRSVMATALVSCQQCHGELLAVGAQYQNRRPWVDMPKCQSCHTGDLVNNLGGALPRTSAYNDSDQIATPILAPASRFAESPNTLYRNSFGHGGMACSACHGSPHAEWPATNPAANDNITAKQIQGHAGPIVECSACHGTNQAATLNGPHGMHNVNSTTWVNEHHDLIERVGLATCQACHGLDLKGSYLSKAAATRTFRHDGKTFTLPAGSAVGCANCHANPLNRRS